LKGGGVSSTSTAFGTSAEIVVIDWIVFDDSPEETLMKPCRPIDDPSWPRIEAHANLRGARLAEIVLRIFALCLGFGLVAKSPAQTPSISFGAGIETSCTLLFQEKGVRRECKLSGEVRTREAMVLDRRVVACVDGMVALAQDARCQVMDAFVGVVKAKGVVAICDGCLDCEGRKLPVSSVSRWKNLHEVFHSLGCLFDAPRIAKGDLPVEDSLRMAGLLPQLDKIRQSRAPTRKDSSYAEAIERRVRELREGARNACQDAISMGRLEAKADSMLKTQGAEF